MVLSTQCAKLRKGHPFNYCSASCKRTNQIPKHGHCTDLTLIANSSTVTPFTLDYNKTQRQMLHQSQDLQFLGYQLGTTSAKRFKSARIYNWFYTCCNSRKLNNSTHSEMRCLKRCADEFRNMWCIYKSFRTSFPTATQRWEDTLPPFGQLSSQKKKKKRKNPYFVPYIITLRSNPASRLSKESLT